MKTVSKTCVKLLITIELLNSHAPVGPKIVPFKILAK